MERVQVKKDETKTQVAELRGFRITFTTSERDGEILGVNYEAEKIETSLIHLAGSVGRDAQFSHYFHRRPMNAEDMDLFLDILKEVKVIMKLGISEQ